MGIDGIRARRGVPAYRDMKRAMEGVPMSDLEQVKAMSDAELDAAIGDEIFGKRFHPAHKSFSTDLNAVAEAEARFDTPDGRPEYDDALTEAIGCHPLNWFAQVTAPARQRAEACLLTWRRLHGSEAK